jgi:hypothetical protein
MYVDSGDSLALIAGIIIVIFVAVMANPEYLAGLQIPVQTAVPTLRVNPQIPVPAMTSPVPSLRITVTPPPLLESHALPYRIVYTDKPYSYPSYRIPENMETFGASEIPQKTLEWVPFAYLEDTRGGLTEVFSVPFPVWVINSTVIASNHPQYGIFRMALCYAESGGIIEGEEILNRGTSYRIVQTSNTDVYMIISAENVDSFYIRLETPRNYYDAYGPA